MIASASPSPAHMASKTSLAILPEIVPSAKRCRSRASAAAETGEPEMSRSALLSAPESSPSTQFAASFAPPGSVAAVASKYAASSRVAVSARASYAVRPYCASKRAFITSGNSGSSDFTRAIQSSSIDERRQVGIGKVAIVLRVFLAAHRARLVPVRIVEPGLLDDRAAVLDQLDLPADLEVDRLLEEAEAVQVLDLAARAELRVRRAAAPRRWRRSESCLPACCRRRCRSTCTSACSVFA